MVRLSPSEGSSPLQGEILVGVPYGEGITLVDVSGLGALGFREANRRAHEVYSNYVKLCPHLVRFVDVRRRREEGIMPSPTPGFPSLEYERVVNEINYAVNEVRLQNAVTTMIKAALIGITMVGIGWLIAETLKSSKGEEEKR